jgi:hypothetical protein
MEKQGFEQVSAVKVYQFAAFTPMLQLKIK